LGPAAYSHLRGGDRRREGTRKGSVNPKSIWEIKKRGVKRRFLGEGAFYAVEAYDKRKGGKLNTDGGKKSLIGYHCHEKSGKQSKRKEGQNSGQNFS